MENLEKIGLVNESGAPHDGLSDPQSDRKIITYLMRLDDVGMVCRLHGTYFLPLDGCFVH